MTKRQYENWVIFSFGYELCKRKAEMQCKVLYHSSRRENQNGNNPAYLDPNRRGMVKRIGGVSPVFRIKKLRKDFDGKTQDVRGSLIAELEELQQWAAKRAKTVRKETLKIQWSHVAAYIAQTITYISSEYDSSKILTRLEALEAKVSELKEKDKQSGKRVRRASGSRKTKGSKRLR